MDTRCPMTTNGGTTRCELREGHNSPHSVNDGGLTWEPVYVWELRQAVRDAERDSWRWLLEAVMEDVGESLRSEALDDAREALAKAKNHNQLPEEGTR